MYNEKKKRENNIYNLKIKLMDYDYLIIEK